MIAVWWLSSLGSAAPATCQFEVDGRPATRLSCSEPGAWQVRCPIPEGTRGKLRARLRIPGRQIEASARLPLPATREPELVVPLAGPGERAGHFLVERATGPLLPGQPLARKHLCPAVQPGVAAGEVVELQAHVALTAHTQTGSVEERADNGVITRVPVYDAGRKLGAASVVLQQLPVSEGLMLAHAAPLPLVEEVTGSLQLQREGAWRTFTWSGTRQQVSGGATVLRLDFPADDVAAAAAEPAGPFLEADLDTWLTGEAASSLLGLVAWRRSGLEPGADTVGLAFSSAGSWRLAESPRISVRLRSKADSVRVVIAHAPNALTAASKSAIDEIATDG